MKKILIAILLMPLALIGCTNTSSKLRAMWDIATDQSPSTSKPDQYNTPIQQTERVEFSDEQMVSGKHLSKKVKKQLAEVIRMAEKADGSVHVICPATATQIILNEIKETGATYNKDNSINSGYVVILSKTRKH